MALRRLCMALIEQLGDDVLEVVCRLLPDGTGICHYVFI